MIRQHHLIRGTIALAAALTASLAPAAWADPAPLAKAEATIAANSQSSTTVRPNPDQQTVSDGTANPGPCSEVCSGGAGSYGPASRDPRRRLSRGATLAYSPRPRSVGGPQRLGPPAPRRRPFASPPTTAAFNGATPGSELAACSQ